MPKYAYAAVHTTQSDRGYIVRFATAEERDAFVRTSPPDVATSGWAEVVDKSDRRVGTAYGIEAEHGLYDPSYPRAWMPHESGGESLRLVVGDELIALRTADEQRTERRRRLEEIDATAKRLGRSREEHVTAGLDPERDARMIAALKADLAELEAEEAR